MDSGWLRSAHEGRGFGVLSRDNQDLAEPQVGGIAIGILAEFPPESGFRCDRVSRVEERQAVIGLKLRQLGIEFDGAGQLLNGRGIVAGLEELPAKLKVRFRSVFGGQAGDWRARLTHKTQRE